MISVSKSWQRQRKLSAGVSMNDINKLGNLGVRPLLKGNHPQHTPLSSLQKIYNFPKTPPILPLIGYPVDIICHNGIFGYGKPGRKEDSCHRYFPRISLLTSVRKFY
jgi:hypothetical protein